MDITVKIPIIKMELEPLLRLYMNLLKLLIIMDLIILLLISISLILILLSLLLNSIYIIYPNKVELLAENLGLERIGWIFTDINHDSFMDSH